MLVVKNFGSSNFMLCGCAQPGPQRWLYCGLTQLSAVFECSACITDGSKKGELGSNHCTLTQKLLPSAHISLSSSKKVCPLLFNI